jgi:hypothetical protein
MLCSGLCVAVASPRPLLAILVLPAPSLGIPASEVYLACRGAIEEETIFRVAGLDIFSRSLEEEAVRECAGDGVCFARKLSDSGSQADWLLTVAMDRLGEDVAIGLRLINIGDALSGKGGERIVSEMIPSSTAPLRGITGMLPKIFDGQGWGQLAGLRVDVEQSGAEILVDEQICVSPCQLEGLSAGTHRVTVQKRGFETWTKTLELTGGRTEKLSISLSSKESENTGSAILMWTGIGLGVAALGLGAWWMTRPSDTVDICIAADPAQCGI